MSAFLKRNTQSGETIRLSVKKHWIVYAGAAVLFAIVLIIYLATELLFYPLIVSATIAFVWAWLLRRSTEVYITDRRILGKWGVLSIAHVVQPLETISSVKVQQGLLGRLFGYGTIIMYGLGLSVTTVPTISDPSTFRRELEMAIQGARRTG